MIIHVRVKDSTSVWLKGEQPEQIPCLVDKSKGGRYLKVPGQYQLGNCKAEGYAQELSPTAPVGAATIQIQNGSTT